MFLDTDREARVSCIMSGFHAMLCVFSSSTEHFFDKQERANVSPENLTRPRQINSRHATLLCTATGYEKAPDQTTLQAERVP